MDRPTEQIIQEEPIDRPDTSAEEQQATQEAFSVLERNKRLCKEYLKDESEDVCDCGADKNPVHGKSIEERLQIARDEKFPDTEWYDSDGDPAERIDDFWTPWRLLWKKDQYEVLLRTVGPFKQPNQPIQIKSRYDGRDAIILINCHQFIELWRLISEVGGRQTA